MKKLQNNYYKIDSELNLKSISNVEFKLKFLVALNVILALITVFLLVKEPVIKRIHHYKTDTITVGDVSLSDTGILRELVANKCILPSIAVAQAKIESGNYKSQVCTANKNLFGIKWHKCNYVLGENLNHASYKSFKDNIKCYIHIQNRYLRNIDGRYAEAGNYVNVLKGMTK